MRITDFRLQKHLVAARKWQRRVCQALLLELDDGTVLVGQLHKRRHRHEIKRIKLRSRFISHVLFNLYALSEKECLENYKFKKADLVHISNMIGWNSRSERNLYRCDPLTATCFVLHKLWTGARSADQEEKYGKFQSQTSEFMWEVVGLFVNKYEYALNMRGGFLWNRAKDYAKSIYDPGAPLPRFVGFIDCTKIRMCRPSGLNANQRAV